ncbi:hypothetical protein A3H22_03085 [Candidatus Peribacteria bacterium RIFCSPLOWO2_12_FULL_55_15]|nr:MAG: hypothetical protein A2789_00360 [Candidatus Peribacteria bacterium RIFCSPHIGHO2_01_FULL_54_22]OGJ63032.1 MAG: hypothetical protein A3D12_00600 [Candidatus Peribacteria bacterium RIFCSPHIGHO2_02_FULL_55_24]OGJ63937.1 MAG: hypothetical protein A3E47_03550 [Candidatus Peribacteria bacterium RIFCSPHIGHO2_12_FULL_54_10]OGJ68349.1 MAG: hypothetical protein A2947_00945 [Candidatus Peribacteria bacterium RIFCSPLOWO2_01_FULL_54_110]OGJ68989.1 MAG: hypothetical protein A3H90_01810 [Candidatus Pe
MARGMFIHTIRTSEVHPEILEARLGKDVWEVLARLRTALIAWDIREERTQFFLDHQADLTGILAFVREEMPESAVRSEVAWYLQELREELRSIIDAGALDAGSCSYFAVYNSPPEHRPVDPQQWHPLTIAFIEELRPSLAAVIKPRYIDKWLQTPHPFLGGASPIQVIDGGQGEHVRDLIGQMRNGFGS